MKILRIVVLFLLVLVVPVLAQGDEPKKVAIVLYDGVEVLDFAGPAEVLEIASAYGRSGERPAFELFTVAPGPDPITSQNFLRVVPDHTPETAPAPDILIIPGGQMRSVLENESFVNWTDRVMENAITLTVCSGASLPARLGKLDGLRVTTWHGILDRMDRRHPEADFVHGLRFVDNDSVITTAGVSAGIDGALHLVARLLGMQVAAETARYMEYAWTPEPHLVSTYPVLNPTLSSAGRAAQIGEMQLQSDDASGAADTYRRALEIAPEDSDLWYGLFRSYAAMEKWSEAMEASLEVAISNPVRGYYNAACAAAQSGRPDSALEYLGRAIESGFRNRSWIEQDEDLAPLRDDPRFQRLLTEM